MRYAIPLEHPADRSPHQGGRCSDEDEARVSIPLWMAQRIQWELEKAGQAHYAACLKSRIATREVNE